MGIMDSMKDFFSRTNKGFDEYEDYEDMEEEVEDTPAPRSRFNNFYTPTAVKREKIVPFESEKKVGAESVSEIMVLKIKNSADAEYVADTLKGGSAVVFDVSEMEDTAEAQSVVDFLHGVACGIGGVHNKITAGIFITTPSNVAIRMEERSVGGKGRWDMNRN